MSEEKEIPCTPKEITVNWLDSKDGGKLNRAVLVKHILGGSKLQWEQN